MAPTSTTPSPPSEPAVIPLLRGWLHLVCAGLSIPFGALIVGHADGDRARLGASVYALGLLILFSVSATYHRTPWSPRVKPWMKRADHAAIFLLIAATYTPFCLVTLSESSGRWLLIAVWTGAIIGVIGAVTGLAERRYVGLVAYISLGWVVVLAMPQLIRELPVLDVALLAAGGIVYTVGAIGLGTRWPDPFPKVFGYHEVWHVLVVVAVVLHYRVVWSAVG